MSHGPINDILATEKVNLNSLLQSTNYSPLPYQSPTNFIDIKRRQMDNTRRWRDLVTTQPFHNT
ncbi:MAG: hypothetical protein CBB86_06270, partial [Candidatus Endolissoclinum sp. TMED26]